jgi:hypothetical protein
MAYSAQLFLLLLAAFAMLGACTVCAWCTRLDPLVTLVCGGSVGLACVSVATISASAG